MCGIAGFVDVARRSSNEELRSSAIAMTDAICYRGPDDSGTWVDASAGVALGHRRLAVIDLSQSGRQPMTSVSGRYVIVYNGELYNYRELRSELVGVTSQSDTAVMLAAFEQWGLDRALDYFNGMFAFALWDTAERKLHLARDRFGEKPLYYGLIGGRFFFASELKAMRALPWFEAEIDRTALTLFTRHNYVPSPYSIYRGIRKLPPGCAQTFSVNSCELSAPTKYWDARQVAARAMAAPFRGTDDDAFAELDRLLRNSVLLRTVSDVPLGAFLSGGIDSSIVVAVMQAQLSRPVRTFSIGFHQAGYDEATQAKAVALHLGTDHTELYLTPKDALAVVARLAKIYDEPFADSSQIPTHLVSRVAREHVAVSLSGDGGDEIFGGYTRYAWAERVWQRLSAVPLKSHVGKAFGKLSSGPAQRRLQTFARMLPIGIRRWLGADSLAKLSAILKAPDLDSAYVHFVAHWADPGPVLSGQGPASTNFSDTERSIAAEPLRQMMFRDTVSYLPDDILTKLDRASMAVSLESRVPFLDARVFEFAWSLPLSFHFRSGKSKWLLRQLLKKYIPAELVERPKKGFSVPVGAWLKGPLREWAESLLDERVLRDGGYLRPDAIRAKWLEHVSGRRDWSSHLWIVLIFQQWLHETHQGRSAPARSTLTMCR